MKQLARLVPILALLVLAVTALAQGDLILRADRADSAGFPLVQADVAVRPWGAPAD